MNVDQDHMKVFAGRASRELAQDMCDVVGLTLGQALDPVGLPFERGQALLRLHVPDLHHPVRARAGQVRVAQGSKAPHAAGVPAQRGEAPLLTGGQLPDLDRLVVRAAEECAPRDGEAHDPTPVPLEGREERARLRVPLLHRLVPRAAEDRALHDGEAPDRTPAPLEGREDLYLPMD